MPDQDDTGQTLWNRGTERSRFSDIPAPANLTEIIADILPAARVAAEERVKPYQTRVTRDLLFWSLD